MNGNERIGSKEILCLIKNNTHIVDLEYGKHFFDNNVLYEVEEAIEQNRLDEKKKHGAMMFVMIVLYCWLLKVKFNTLDWIGDA